MVHHVNGGIGAASPSALMPHAQSERAHNTRLSRLSACIMNGVSKLCNRLAAWRSSQCMRSPAVQLTDRGGALHQIKNWEPVVLGQETEGKGAESKKNLIFIHAGSAPLRSEDGEGLLLSYAKEEIAVKGHPQAPNKYNLAMPFNTVDCFESLPERLSRTKAIDMLWDRRETPHAFIFKLTPGTEVWTQGGKITANREVGIPRDLRWSGNESVQVKEYIRDGKEWVSVTAQATAGSQ